MDDFVILLQMEKPKPNPMFSEFQHSMTVFLRFNKPVPCAECGRRSKTHWTSRCSFKAMDMKGSLFVLKSATGRIHIPMTPVCTSHPMALVEHSYPPVKRERENSPARKRRAG